jgi:hypothetical protein
MEHLVLQSVPLERELALPVVLVLRMVEQMVGQQLAQLLVVQGMGLDAQQFCQLGTELGFLPELVLQLEHQPVVPQLG